MARNFVRERGIWKYYPFIRDVLVSGIMSGGVLSRIDRDLSTSISPGTEFCSTGKGMLVSSDVTAAQQQDPSSLPAFQRTDTCE